MKITASFRKRLPLAILLISLTLHIQLVFCEETNITDLEDKILSLVDKGDGKFDSEALHSAIECIDTLSVDKAIVLLVRLLDYYLGEASGALFMEKVTIIGDKILPYLVQKRNMPKITCRNKYKEICLTMQERNMLIDRAIKGIKDGRVLYSIFPEKLENEAEQYLTILHIFIEDFRKQRSNLPKNLQELKEYGWIRYGYKIKIINPWGHPYKYIRKGNKYVIGEATRGRS